VLLAEQSPLGYDLWKHPFQDTATFWVIPLTTLGLTKNRKEEPVANLLLHLWNDDRGQDIAEYAVMLAVILVIVVGTIRLIGSNANNVFSQVGSSIQ
jgi:Flp pilus assembly pilin Flp